MRYVVEFFCAWASSYFFSEFNFIVIFSCSWMLYYIQTMTPQPPQFVSISSLIWFCRPYEMSDVQYEFFHSLSDNDFLRLYLYVDHIYRQTVFFLIYTKFKLIGTFLQPFVNFYEITDFFFCLRRYVIIDLLNIIVQRRQLGLQMFSQWQHVCKENGCTCQNVPGTEM